MMNVKQYYLAKLAEECNEVAQRALKQMQFGAGERQNTPSGKSELTNSERLRDEIYDLATVVQILEELGEVKLDAEEFEIAEENKRTKLEKYLVYSQALGLVLDVEKAVTL